jgi:hypothetical protein
LLDKGVKAEEIAAEIPGGGLLEKAPDLKEILTLAEKTYGGSVAQKEVGLQLKKHWQVSPPESCAACHR